MDTRQSAWLDRLNPQQRKAVTYGEGPLLIVAGAGTGKTTTLAYRVSHLISCGAQPERILLLTFTRRAAEDMLRRASGAATGPSIAQRVWGGTFHSIANRVIRMYAQSAGLPANFTIIDRSDAEDLLDVVRNELSLSRTDVRFPRKATCMDIYSRRVNGQEGLGQVLDKYFPWCSLWKDELNRLFRAYAERKRDRSILDYDDLLLYWHHLLQDDRLAESIGGRFDHVLVDEYQDTNWVQSGILGGLRRFNKNITVVGDDAQSIYSFRSATVRNMLDFPAIFPGASVITLEQNYRSVQPILDTTNRVIEQARERYSKELWSERKAAQRPVLVTCADEKQQDEAVIRYVLEHREQGIPLRKQAVLFRASHHSDSLELALTRRNIPFHKYGGLRFLEASHIKDVLALLRIIENSGDEPAWFRVLQLVKNVGPATAASAIRHLRERGWAHSALSSFKTTAASSEGLLNLCALVDDLVHLRDRGPSVQIDRILLFYRPILEQNTENPGPRAADLGHLARMAENCPSTEQFLTDMVLDPPVTTGDLAGPPTKDDDWLVLSTIHSAKGLEWDAVYLIHAADGCLPSDLCTGDAEETEEELRLAYVAMTRARNFLYVLWPLRYYHKLGTLTDKHSYAQRSRFLSDKVVQGMDQVAQGYPNPSPAQPPGANAPQMDISRRILDMWQ